jgi:hypothetical protein
MNFDFTPRPVTDLAQKMSTLTGTPVDAQVLSLDKIRAAMSEGVMVKLRCRAWTGEVKLDQLDATNMFDGDSYISSARIRLIGNKDYAAITRRVSAVKNCVSKYALKVEGYTGVFLPADRWTSFRDDFNKSKAELLRAGVMLSQRWENLRDQARLRLGRLAENAWPNYCAEWNDLGECAPGTYADKDEPSEVFREFIIEKYVSKIPHQDVMVSRFDASYSLSVLYIPELEYQIKSLAKHPDLIESLKNSLEAQRNGLPYQFATSVVENLLQETYSLRDYLALERPNLRFSLALSRCMRFIQHWRELNLIADSTLEREIRTFDVGIKRLAARTTVKKHVNGQEMFELVETLAKNIEKLLSDIKVT